MRSAQSGSRAQQDQYCEMRAIKTGLQQLPNPLFAATFFSSRLMSQINNLCSFGIWKPKKSVRSADKSSFKERGNKFVFNLVNSFNSLWNTRFVKPHKYFRKNRKGIIRYHLNPYATLIKGLLTDCIRAIYALQHSGGGKIIIFFYILADNDA